MANSNISGGLGGADAYGGLASPSASVLAKVEKTMAGQSGSVAKLNQNISRDQAKLSGLGQLQSALAEFQHVAERLAGAGLSTSASSSATGVVTVTASGTAKAGAHTVDVKQLAQSQVLTSAARQAANTKIGTGAPAIVKIETGVTGTDSFTPGKQAAKTITIDQSNNTLDGIAAAFKSAGIDASVVKSGNGFALSVKSASGEANSLRISVSGDAAVKDLLAGKGLTQTAAARDAVVAIDGKESRSAANTVETGGLALALKGTGKADVTVKQDSSEVARNVAGFVDAYNGLQDKLGVLDKGALKSDQALSQASRDLAGLLRSGTSASELAKVGVSINGDGRLQVDDKQLKAAITADPDAVVKLFTNEGKGLADQFDAKVDALTGKSGAINRETQQVNKELTALNDKKAGVAKALTAQANALAKLYAAQEQSASGDALPGYTGPRSLFDFLA
ncbi:flagellar filament capping protein FliD [Pseudoduganella ginsengisoli]|uniref:Flagellar hook-associated protein 2 n=1 Tax=Pseudoduganella ginsengisoli TaxID=1462440 RepID=A0A6L6Q1F6_9BURK|nr:flagellar filament capping protein FliD [Pseudoduganella ginsengisoli]MTW03460.1 flagellar filament capping protein FliD [Pseudoduganella ginsengisoli]